LILPSASARLKFIFSRPRHPQKQRQQPFHRQYAFIVNRADYLADIDASGLLGT